MIAKLYLDAVGKPFGFSNGLMGDSPDPPNTAFTFEFDPDTNPGLTAICSLQPEWVNLLVTNPGTAQAKLNWNGKVMTVNNDTAATAAKRTAKKALQTIKANLAAVPQVSPSAIDLANVQLGILDKIGGL